MNVADMRRFAAVQHSKPAGFRRDQPVTSINRPDQRDCRHESPGASGVTAQLQREPEHAGTGDQAQQGRRGQIAIDADAGGQRHADRVPSHIPDRIDGVPKKPRCALQCDPQDEQQEKRRREQHIPKADRMRFTPQHQARFVQNRKSGKEYRVNAPRDRLVAAMPERDPGEPGDKQAENRMLDETGSPRPIRYLRRGGYAGCGLRHAPPGQISICRRCRT